MHDLLSRPSAGIFLPSFPRRGYGGPGTIRMTEHIEHLKTLKLRDMILFTVSAILLADTLTAAASVGASSVSWWIILGVLFFIPFAMICAEMGCAYPEQGGIYAWIRDGFGGRWASRATWCYWVNTAVWIPAIIYGMLGFELVSAGSDEMKDPARDVPRAIFISGVIIITLYILGTMAVLAAIPSGDINLVEGLVDTLTLFFGESLAGQALVTILGLGALFSFFSNGVTWALGCNRAAAEAAMEGELPKIFAVEDKQRGTPVGSAVLMGLVSTLCLVLYGFMSGSNEELFWSLFAFSAVIFLLPYQGMMLAFLKMRRVDAAHPRPYKVPGGTGTARLAASLCISILAISIFLFVYTPGSGFEWAVVGGVIVTLIIGEVVIRLAENHCNPAEN